jgi:hypothetical protein
MGNKISPGVIKVRLLANIGELEALAPIIENALTASGYKILETSPIGPSDNPTLERKYITFIAQNGAALHG